MNPRIKKYLRLKAKAAKEAAAAEVPVTTGSKTETKKTTKKKKPFWPRKNED